MSKIPPPQWEDPEAFVPDEAVDGDVEEDEEQRDESPEAPARRTDQERGSQEGRGADDETSEP